MSNYAYWLAALRLTDGKRQMTREEMTACGISEDIGAGFFRKRTGPREPFDSLVAIWEQDGQMVATVDGVEANAEEVWLYAARYPISESEYRELAAQWTVTAEELDQSEREFT